MSSSSTAPDLRYPVGRYQRPQHVGAEERARYIAVIEALPDQLRTALANCSDAELDTPYRPDGWTVRQVVHHFADSHMNSYIRFKLALTEDEPAVKTYAEDQWAELPEAKSAPIGVSLDLIDSLHRRWVLMLRDMSDAEYARTFRHPDWGPMRLDANLALYEWHCRHHLAHIHQALQSRA